MDNEDDIETFLDRLKLADKYLDAFKCNGYTTVTSCKNISEDQLKNIGVTLPGHYKRILSNLAKVTPNKLISVLSSPMLLEDQSANKEEESVYETAATSIILQNESDPLSLADNEEKADRPISPNEALPAPPQEIIETVQISKQDASPEPTHSPFTFLSKNIPDIETYTEDSDLSSDSEYPDFPPPLTPDELELFLPNSGGNTAAGDYDTLNLERSSSKNEEDASSQYGHLESEESKINITNMNTSIKKALSGARTGSAEYEEVDIVADKSDSKNSELMGTGADEKASDKDEEVLGLTKSAEIALVKRHKSSSADAVSFEHGEAIYEDLDKDESSPTFGEDVYDLAAYEPESPINYLPEDTKPSPTLSRKSVITSKKSTYRDKFKHIGKPINVTLTESAQNDDDNDQYAEISEEVASKRQADIMREKKGGTKGARPSSVFLSQYGSSLTPDRNRTYSATLDRNNMTYKTGERGALRSLVSPQTKRKTKEGWLLKHGGHDGKAPQRRRWVVFDGDELRYYEKEKVEITKGIIPIEAMMRVQPQSDSLSFHVHVKGGRKYIFQAENSEQRNVWTSTLMAGIMQYETTLKSDNEKQPNQFKYGGVMYMPYKEGYIKMEGSRNKIYLVTKGEYMAYYKNSTEFNWAQPTVRLKMNLASIRETDKKKFQIIFPFRTFTFYADNEEEKSSWVESLRDAISESLSDYKVLNEVWENAENKRCADCGRESPDWASINLAIVICKHCAGVHRELGVQSSKVRSLKMDIKVWTPSMIQLLQDFGNEIANYFWCDSLNMSDTITDMSDKQQRKWFINTKYMEMKYVTRPHRDPEFLNNALIESIRDDEIRKFYACIFSGANVNCDTGKEHASTPLLYAHYLKRITFVELLKQNGATTEKGQAPTDLKSAFPHKSNSIHKSTKPPVSLREVLYKYGGDFKKNVPEEKNVNIKKLALTIPRPREFQKRLCILENQELKYCEPDKPMTAKDQFPCKEIISIGTAVPDIASKAGFQHVFEISRKSGRTYLFCTDKEENRKKWTSSLMQAIVPPHIQDQLGTDEDYDRVGWLSMRSQNWTHSSGEWSETMCRLHGKKLQYYHNTARSVETIDLRKLVQITHDQANELNPVTSSHQGKDNIPVIMLVFKEKSYFFQSCTKSDAESWMKAIKKADSDSGPLLENQQLTPEGVPILLEKCITFVEQYGLQTQGIYRLSGTHSKTTNLLKSFRENARETQMKEGDLNVHDVSNALKRWFKTLPGSLFTKNLHKEWIDTAQIKSEFHNQKMDWYKHLLDKLPEINKITLKVVLMHLKKVADPKNENEMSPHNLAIVFGPTLMEPPSGTDSDANNNFGDTSQEIACIEDLLEYYDWLFDVTESDRDKERMLQEAKEKISVATQQQNMLTTLDYEMMIPIYILSRGDKCVNHKINMSAMELVNKICTQHGYPKDKWGLFEVISDGEAERPLHYTEHVLTVIKSWQLPSTNYMVCKSDYFRDKMRWFKKTIPGDVSIILEMPLKSYVSSKKKWVKVAASLVRDINNVYFFKYIKNADLVSSSNVGSVNWRKKSIRSHVLGKGNISWLSNSADDGKTPISFEINTFKVYVGVDKKTKPTGNGKQGFTILPFDGSPVCFLAEAEGDMYKLVSNILHLMHSDGFTPPSSEYNTPNSGSPSPLYGSRPSSKSNSLVRNLQELNTAMQSLHRSYSNSSDSSKTLSPKPMRTSSNDETTVAYNEDIYDSAFDSEQPVFRRPSAKRSNDRRPAGNMSNKLHDELSNVLKNRPPH